MSINFDLSRLRVLITGSTRGIGFYVAKSLAKWGASVVINGRSREAIKKALGEIKKASARGRVYGVAANLLEAASVERLFREAWKLLGGLDAIIVNVGNVTCEPCYLHEVSYKDWLEAAKLHTIAPGYLASLFVKRLLEENSRGSILFLSSVTIKEPMSHFVLADTCRAGLVQLAKSIARFYGGKGIRAVTILLGSFDTPGARRNIRILAERRGIDFDTAWREWVLELTPLKRTGREEEIGALIAYLLSPLAEYINGSTLVLDGAMSRCT